MIMEKLIDILQESGYSENEAMHLLAAFLEEEVDLFLESQKFYMKKHHMC